MATESKRYWSGNGEMQAEYDEMVKAGWEFTKATEADMHRYYRYYNDGDLPGWARGKHEWTAWDSFRYGSYRRPHGGWKLNTAGEDELERRATESIRREYKRFTKAMKKA